MKIKIVGNGIAALMLAEKLQKENIQVSVLGAGPPQTPPQVMVHLYAGRSFRRSQLEVDAFKEAITYWRQSPFSTETKVNRDTNSRLEKSLVQTENYPWKSPVLDNQTFSYGPAFVIDAWGLMDAIRSDVDYKKIHIDKTNTNELEDSDQVVWATGFQNQLSSCVLNTGASIAIQDEDTPTQILIGKGVHHASNATMSSLGGAFLNEDLSSPKSLLIERAKEIIPAGKSTDFENADIFIGKKSVSKDRLPLIGVNENGDFLFTAFGARAFFWLPYSSKLAYELLSDKITNSPCSPLRFKKQEL